MSYLNRTNRSRRAALGLAFAASALVLPLALSGCSNATPTAEVGASQEHQESEIVTRDMWAKSTDPDDTSGHAMSGVFGEIENTSSTDLTITSASSEVAGVVELHEVVDGVMREIQGDVVIPANGTLLLEPGADHIMLMELSEDLLPGDEVPIVLELSNGTTVNFSALVKDTAGANESYGGHDSHDDHENHDDH